MKHTYLDLEKPRQGSSMKELLISQYARKLNFPDYWNPNWDSFEECLTDKLENSDMHLHIRHVGWSKEDYELLGPYVEILNDIAAATSKITIRSLT